MKFYILLGVMSALLFLTNCKRTEENHHHHDEEEIEAKHNEVNFCAHKAEELGFQTRVIQPTNFQHVIKTGGRIIAAQGKEATASATISGIVSLPHTLVEGVKVNQGTPLANISSKNTTEGEPYEKARIAFKSAKSEYDRTQPLATKKIVSEKEFNQIKQTYEEAKLAFDAMQRYNSPTGQNIPAPIQGYVKNIWVKEGDYVEMGQPIASVTQTQHLYLSAEVAERYYDQLPYITSANFKTPYQDECFSLETLNGKLLSVGKSTKENANFIPLTFSFENIKNIVPGAYMDVFLLSHPIPNQLVIPLSALIEEQGLFHIYIQLDEETYLKKEVKLGMNNGNEVQILNGLHPNDKVVVKGAQQLKLASASGAIPAHSHHH